jgi:hypothetical protein
MNSISGLIELGSYQLPDSFARIRNFGFLANRRHATFWPLCFSLLGSAPQRL